LKRSVVAEAATDGLQVMVVRSALQAHRVVAQLLGGNDPLAIVSDVIVGSVGHSKAVSSTPASKRPAASGGPPAS
jgi:hypothetical protein